MDIGVLKDDDDFDVAIGFKNIFAVGVVVVFLVDDFLVLFVVAALVPRPLGCIVVDPNVSDGFVVNDDKIVAAVLSVIAAFTGTIGFFVVDPTLVMVVAGIVVVAFLL